MTGKCVNTHRSYMFLTQYFHIFKYLQVKNSKLVQQYKYSKVSNNYATPPKHIIPMSL